MQGLTIGKIAKQAGVNIEAISLVSATRLAGRTKKAVRGLLTLFLGLGETGALHKTRAGSRVHAGGGSRRLSAASVSLVRSSVRMYAGPHGQRASGHV